VIRTFELTRGTVRFEGTVYSDGAVSVRRLSADHCGRITFSFEGISECEAELGFDVPAPKTCEGWTVYEMPLHSIPKEAVAGEAPRELFFKSGDTYVSLRTEKQELFLNGKSVGVFEPGTYTYTPDDNEPEDVEA
jgi:hypothetical protein